MTTSLQFDVLSLLPFKNLRQWRTRYSSSIRALANFKGLKAPVGCAILSPQMEAWLVWYTDGDWKTGNPIRAVPGPSLTLIRVPAVKMGERFLVVDGCHRITQLRPMMIVLDFVKVKKADAPRFADFTNPFWRKYIEALPGP